MIPTDNLILLQRIRESLGLVYHLLHLLSGDISKGKHQEELAKLYQHLIKIDDILDREVCE